MADIELSDYSWDELIDLWIQIDKEMLAHRPPRPKNLPWGVSWTTREMREMVKQHEDILELIAYRAQREFLLEVERRGK